MDLEPSIKELTKGVISSCVGPGVATITFLDALERFSEKTREYIIDRTVAHAERLIDGKSKGRSRSAADQSERQDRRDDRQLVA